MAGNKKTDKGKGASKGDAKGGKGESSSKGDTKARGAQSINVRHILCEKHSKKEEALTKIREGASFDSVAKDFSEDKARQGGNLGWKTKGSLDAAFEAVAFELETSSTNRPKIAECKTEHGYHIIMVEGRK